MDTISNVTVQGQGGYIDQLGIVNAGNVSIDGLVTDVTIAQQLYDFKFSNLRGVTTKPSAFFYTYLWNGSVSNVVSYGSKVTSDNGNVKFPWRSERRDHGDFDVGRSRVCGDLSHS